MNATYTVRRTDPLTALDQDKATLTVAVSSTQVDREVVTTDTKSSEVRVVALDPATIAALKVCRRQQATERLKAGEAWQDTGLMFTWEDGSRVLPDYLSKEFVKVQDGLNLPRLTLPAPGTLTLARCCARVSRCTSLRLVWVTLTRV